MIGYAANDMAFEVLEDKLGIKRSADFRGALFVPDECAGKLAEKEDVGVAIGWNGFVGRTCMINIVVQKPECLTRWVIGEIFRFPFEICGLNAVLATVDNVNKKSLELCRRSGFEKIHTIPDGGTEGDLVCFVMTRAKCRWLRKVH